MTEAKRGIPLHTKIFIGLILGAVTGGIAQATIGKSDPAALKNFVDNVATPLGRVFLYLIFMIVVPLLFSALVLGVAEIGSAKKFGRIGIRSALMTLLLSGIAVILGLTAVNIVRPGEQIPQAQKEALIAQYQDKAAADKNIATAKTTPDDPPVFGVIPRNPMKEMNRALEGGLLPFMFFALMFGLALASIEPERSVPVVNFFDGIFGASLKIIDWAMKLAPFGVFFLVFTATATLGWNILQAIGLYAGLVLVVLAFHLFVVYSVVLKTIAKMNPLDFFRRIRTVMLTAFATSSSNATLPAALKSADEDLGLPKDISSFVLTVGATANQNGTALFEGITILFLAQLFGIPLDLGQQLMVMGLAIVAGIGTAGVPGGAWPFIASILFTLGVPPEGIGLILGIDRILDMSRTVLNVSGDLVIATCVSAWEGPDAKQEVAASYA
jgi:DAACS family dicarboxylate/amino acid:cation (Na+ or H+) symporter